PNHRGLGGLARRATVIANIRKKELPLLVDAGNWLVGTESVASRGQIIVAAYDAMGYDVVHLTPKDLYWGKEKTLEVLKQAKFAVVSANLIDEQTGKPLVSAYSVKKSGNVKVAFLG